MTTNLRWLGTLALACTCSATSIAQPPPPNESIMGIAHIAFRVSDLDRHLAFLGKLGYEEAFTTTNGGQATEVFIKINDRQFIDCFRKPAPSAQPIGLMNVCFEAGDLNALERYYASEGLNPSPVRKASGRRSHLLLQRSRGPCYRVHPVHAGLTPDSRHRTAPGRRGASQRVLMGFDLPVRDGAAMKEFYTDLGFTAEEVNGNVRLTTPGAPDVHIELRPARPGSQPENCSSPWIRAEPGETGVRGRSRPAQRRARLRPRSRRQPLRIS